MYQSKHKAIKTLSANLSIGMNIGLVIFFFLVLMIKNELWNKAVARSTIICHPFIFSSNDPLIVNVNKTNITLQIPYPNIRKSTLAYMEQSYGIRFTDKVRSDFMKTGIVAAPISKLKRLDGKTSEIKPPRMDLEIPPQKYKNSELNRWILGARMADVAFNGRYLPIVVKIDSLSNLKLLDHVCDVLDDQHAHFTIQ